MTVGRLKETYLNTFQYRLALHKTLNYYSKAIISDPVFLYPIVIAGNINREILKQIDVLDNLLSSIIDPEFKQIPPDYIKSRFNYPDIDIQMVDLDWI